MLFEKYVIPVILSTSFSRTVLYIRNYFVLAILSFKDWLAPNSVQLHTGNFWYIVYELSTQGAEILVRVPLLYKNSQLYKQELKYDTSEPASHEISLLDLRLPFERGPH